MVKYPQMKFAVAVFFAFFSFSALASARVVVPSLPEAVRPDAEVSTNIELTVNAARLQTLTLSVEFESCVTNEVLVAIGADADLDDDLSVDEADIVFGCDCGAWYRADLRTGEIETATTNALVIGKREFDPAWNLAKVVRRGFGEIGETVSVDADADYEVLATAPKQDTGDSIEGAQVIVAGGRGIKEEADLEPLKELAALLDGKLAASRPLVDNGWLAHEKQIGQSGATIKPRYIFNVAISGSVQYQVGMQNAGCVISINHTKGAPIFDISHYGAVADYKTVIPALVEEIKRRKA